MPVDPKLQASRRDAIRVILQRRRIADQGELLARLRSRGIRATQSSVSRDLAALGAVKREGAYRLPSEEPAMEVPELAEVAAWLGETAAAGPHLLVVKTAVGAAQSVAVALDGAGWSEVVGTVAGDDTIFVATPGVAAQKRLKRRIESVVHSIDHS